MRHVDRRTWLQRGARLLILFVLLFFLVSILEFSVAITRTGEVRTATTDFQDSFLLFIQTSSQLAIAGQTMTWFDTENGQPSTVLEPNRFCTTDVNCAEGETSVAAEQLNGELKVPEKTIAGGEHLILRYDTLPHDKIETRFPPGYKYYYVDRFGLFDMVHIKHGREQMEQVLHQIHADHIKLSFVTQKSVTTNTAVRLTAIYHIAPELSYKQRLHAALGIAMDFEQLIEAHQSPGSAFSVEDLPSDYVGYFLALNPEWQPQELLTMLDGDKTPTGFTAPKAHLYKSFRRNREFRPIPEFGAEPVNWPLLLRMEPAGRWSGYWNRTFVLTTRDQRTWWQRWSDWGIGVARVFF